MFDDQKDSKNDTILRIKEVSRRTGLSVSWINAQMAKGLFPKSFKIIEGGRAKGWSEKVIQRFIDSRVTNSNNG